MGQSFTQIGLFADLAAAVEGVSYENMNAVEPEALAPRARVVGILSKPLRALYYVGRKATRDAKVAELNIELAPVSEKRGAETHARTLKLRASWIEASFHLAVAQELPVVNSGSGFAVYKNWQVAVIPEESDEDDGLSGLTDMLAQVLTGRVRA